MLQFHMYVKEGGIQKCTLRSANFAQSAQSMAKCATLKGTLRKVLEVLRMA